MINAGSEVLFDITDGQAEIGLTTIYNNAFNTNLIADVVIYDYGSRWNWHADVGSWKVGGNIQIPMHLVRHSVMAGDAGGRFAHEFIHLVFDALDEYVSWPNCIYNPNIRVSPTCPTGSMGASTCLMAREITLGELCWSGNHEAINATQQSQCRGRSCWEQIVWSWPNSFLSPGGAPDPDANGLTVNLPEYLEADNTMRVVLVLDESNSMNLDSPSRVERLKVAAKDFVALAEIGTELGIVSYSTNAESGDGHISIPIATLGNNRTIWNNAIDGLTPGGWTNIGDGLQKALDMINDAGGVTANTAILLMTDGINNRPEPQTAADADLQSKLDALLNAGIPVYVTCVGNDLGLASQCSEIAIATGGFFMASADAAYLPESFIDIHERIAGRNPINSFASWRHEQDRKLLVEENSESVTFTLIWQDASPNISATMFMIDPDGNQYPSTKIPQGRFVRVNKPIPGEWEMLSDWSGAAPESYIKRGYVRNRIHSLGVGIRYASVLPGEAIHIYAYPRSFGGAITDSASQIQATVLRPDGTTDFIELNDMGRFLVENPDDLEDDGIFTGIYQNTNLQGSYEFLLRADIDRWKQAGIHPDSSLETQILSARFTREGKISGAVYDEQSLERTTEDEGDRPEIEKYPWWYILVFILSVLIIFYLFRFLSRNR